MYAAIRGQVQNVGTLAGGGLSRSALTLTLPVSAGGSTRQDLLICATDDGPRAAISPLVPPGPVRAELLRGPIFVSALLLRK